MSIGKRFRLLNIASVGLVIGLVISIALALINQRNLNDAQETRFESYLLANELRASSEDLTRLARTYVITGESKYEDMYWDVLAIRSGKKPRPEGRTVALQELMAQRGFTVLEFGKLKEAENRSNDLVKIETIAMNAVKGLYDDGTGQYTKKAEPDPTMAARIMHDATYHKNKASIGQPISEFETMLNARTNEAVARYVFRGNLVLGVIAILSGLTALALFMMIKNVRAVLGQIVGKLKIAADQTSQYTAELVSTAKNLSDSSSEQAAAVQETAATLNEINSMVSKSEENAHKSANFAQSGRDTAEGGLRAVNDVIQAISDINEGNSDIATQMADGNRQLEEIIKIISAIESKTKVIDEIVFQTKLLSFNASVEAARAGEHGKGFAVVAEEVGNLASMSGQSAREITEMLDASVKRVEGIVSDSTRRISDLMSSADQRVKKGTSLAEACGESLTNVVQVASDLKSMVEQISRATEEQANGVSAITTAVDHINTSTQQNAQTAEVTSSLSRSLESSTRELLSLVDTIEVEILGKSSSGTGTHHVSSVRSSAFAARDIDSEDMAA